MHYRTVLYIIYTYIVCQKVRRELYSQCFDELIRQTTLSCEERGLLLLRVRDEFRMTIHAYMVTVWRR